MRPVLLALALWQGVSTPFSLKPEPPRHVRVATSSTVDRAGRVSLFLDVAPMPGIHVYAPGARDYKPIGLAIAPQSGLMVGKLTYPKSETLMDGTERVPVFNAAFRLTQPITAGDSASSPLIVTGTVDYQACDDRLCYKPESIAVSWTLARD